MFHLRRDRLHHRRESLAAIIDLRDVGIGLPREMNELHLFAIAMPHRQRLQNKLVDAVPSTASAHHEHNQAAQGFNPNFSRRDRAIDSLETTRRTGVPVTTQWAAAQIIRAAHRKPSIVLFTQRRDHSA